MTKNGKITQEKRSREDAKKPLDNNKKKKKWGKTNGEKKLGLSEGKRFVG